MVWARTRTSNPIGTGIHKCRFWSANSRPKLAVNWSSDEFVFSIFDGFSSGNRQREFPEVLILVMLHSCTVNAAKVSIVHLDSF